MKSILVCFLFILSSCATNKNLKEDKRNLKLLKQYAYCKCMEQSLKTLSRIDTSEVCSGEVENFMDYNGLYAKEIEPIFDSLALVIVKRQIAAKHDSSINKHESAIGTTTYMLTCLNFYNSKQLDSFVKTIPKKLYAVSLSE